MADASWVVEKLSRRHERGDFSCGLESMDTYLRLYAGQNERTGISQHYVATRGGDPRVLGFYALSAGAVAFEEVPDSLTRSLPRYPVPVAHLGRLAVDRSVQGQGLGSHLLVDALARIVRVSSEIGIHAVEVIATDARAREFYRRFGFARLEDDRNHLYLPLSVVRRSGLA